MISQNMLSLNGNLFEFLRYLLHQSIVSFLIDIVDPVAQVNYEVRLSLICMTHKTI